MAQIDIVNREKTQQKVIISKEKHFVSFKKVWESVVDEAHKLSIKTGAHVAIAAYSPSATPFTYDYFVSIFVNTDMVRITWVYFSTSWTHYPNNGKAVNYPLTH